MKKTTPNGTIVDTLWLLTEACPTTITFPEDICPLAKRQTEKYKAFLNREVSPFIEIMDAGDIQKMPLILKAAGKAGLLAIATPEKWGGLGKNFLEAGLATEILGAGNCFSVAYAAHTGIGLLPILYFGTEKQKEQYLHKLSSGEYMGAYALTEPQSGSDALAASTTAILSDDQKHYILNGQKCWITNGGFADIFTVFVKIKSTDPAVPDPGFSAFIVEKKFEGFTQGPPEKKMGIKGSSTTALYFNNCKVPVENLLGEAGKGHIIAFNILNIGRLKLAQFNLGAAKHSLQKITHTFQELDTVQQRIYQKKIALTATRIFACESAIYRTVSLIQSMHTTKQDKD